MKPETLTTLKAFVNAIYTNQSLKKEKRKTLNELAKFYNVNTSMLTVVRKSGYLENGQLLIMPELAIPALADAYDNYRNESMRRFREKKYMETLFNDNPQPVDTEQKPEYEPETGSDVADFLIKAQSQANLLGRLEAVSKSFEEVNKSMMLILEELRESKFFIMS